MREKRVCLMKIVALCAAVAALWGNGNCAMASGDWRYCLTKEGFQKQQKSNWCWAASARNMAVSRYHYTNIRKSQEDIVKYIWGSVVNKSADIQSTAKAVNYATGDNNAIGVNNKISYKAIKSKIEKQKATIVGLQGPLGSHAVLLTGYDYNSKDVEIFDPKIGILKMPYNELRDGIKHYPGYEFKMTVYYK